MNNQNRIKGMLWGLIVGDCMGSPIQFTAKDNHPYLTEMEKCPVFGVPAGYWTDDSSMALCIMDSFMRRGGYDLLDIGDTFVKWLEEGYLSSIEGQAFDVGNATRLSVAAIKRGCLVNGVESSQGNGSIMRFAPGWLIANAVAAQTTADSVAGNQAAQDEIARKIMFEISDLTHASRRVHQVVVRMAAILDRHLRGEKTDAVSAFATREAVDNSGWAVSTLEAALWAFNTTSSFEAGMLAAINLGGDSDTIGAVYGQIAGTYYGFAAIPERWLKQVKTWEKIDRFIDNFIEKLRCYGLGDRQ